MALYIGGVAVDATAAEIDVLDGLDRGSIIYGNASSVTTVLDQGGADEVLTSDGTDIAWAAAGGGGISHDGSTADGVLTYKDADEATVEANLTFDGTDLTVEAGDIIFGTAGKGICLGVTSNTDANTLDDYEEGLHIATLTCASGGGYSLHGDVDTLRYTKIGRLVTVQGYVIATAEDGTPSGNLRLSVPFANSPTTEASALLGGTLRFIGHATTHAGAPACQISGSAAYLVFAMTNDDGTEEYMDNDDVDTTIQSFHLVVNITYMAAT